MRPKKTIGRNACQNHFGAPPHCGNFDNPCFSRCFVCVRKTLGCHSGVRANGPAFRAVPE
jgi:hypothetical protein